MKRIVLIAAAMLCASDAFACAPDDYLCQGFEKSERRHRQNFEDTQHMLDVIRQTGDALDRDLDAIQRSQDQTFTDSLIMNLDRR